MNYTEALTRYTANFIDELTAHGLRDVVISPGSRSTPLAVLFAEHEKVNDWIVVDERSAAYFALGIAQATKRPVALVCTSGTATANYMPAIAEAFYARVPLIVLTADRPHELRDVGASQTMNQIGMYRDFVKLFYEMALPEAQDEMLAYVRNRALRAMNIASADSRGPVHLNFPFREPLIPDVTLNNLWGSQKQKYKSSVFSGEKSLPEAELQTLASFISENRRGLLVCGPQADERLAKAISALSDRLNVPILADPLSQLRAGKFMNNNIIATYDSLFRSEKIRTELKPDYIIRFGAMPISKHFSFYIDEHSDVQQFVVENDGMVREPTNNASHYVIADGTFLCEDLLSQIERNDRENKTWIARWKNIDSIVKEELRNVDSDKLTEGTAVHHVIEQLDEQSHLFIANSMPIRDVDTFFMPTEKQIRTYANRGLSGIDGTLSSALGVATTGKHVTLVIGDLSFYHDLNSLLIAKRYRLPITIVLINNNGGGIFSFLPQAQEEEKYFEHLFGTPLDIDFKHGVTMYGGKYNIVTEGHELAKALQENRKLETFSVVEVRTDRSENVVWHRQLWEKIIQRLERHDEV